MNKKHILSTRCAITQQNLRAADVLHLRVFGSVARDEATAESDVDLLQNSIDRRR